MLFSPEELEDVNRHSLELSMDMECARVLILTLDDLRYEFPKEHARRRPSCHSIIPHLETIFCP